MIKYASTKLSLTLLFLIFSCASHLTEEDKTQLSKKIESRNTLLRLKFVADSSAEVIKIVKENYPKPEHAIKDYLKSHMDSFSTNWNNPYAIKKDRNLTLDKYLNYCRENKTDPKDYINYMD
jgi:Mg2+ and Co2+ transporter CorA